MRNPASIIYTTLSVILSNALPINCCSHEQYLFFTLPLTRPLVPSTPHNLHLRQWRPKRRSLRHLFLSRPPHILTTPPSHLPIILSILPLSPPIPNHILLRFIRIRSCLHAKPEIAPVVGTVSYFSMAVQVVELAAEGLTEEGWIESVAARQGGGEEGVG